MAKRKALTGLGPARPSIRDLSHGTPLIGQPHFNVMRAQDSAVAQSRRIVMSWGMRGAQETRIPSDAVGYDPVTGTTRTLPNATTWIPAAVSKAVLTPGCFLEAWIVYLPSGPTQEFSAPDLDHDNEFNHYHGSGGLGHVRVRATFYAQNGVDDSGELAFERALPASPLPDNQLPAADGGAWSVVREAKIPAIQPAISDADELVKFSEHCTVELAVDVKGSPRVVQLVVYEVPVAHARDDSGPTLPGGSVHAYTASSSGLPTPYPQEQQADLGLVAEYRYGTRQTIAVEGVQGLYLGPRAMQWDSYVEDPDLAVDVVEPVTVSATSGNFVCLTEQTQIGYDPDAPGWILPGPHARTHAWNDEALILRGRAAVMPVRVWAYVTASTISPIPILRFQSSARSWVDLDCEITEGAQWVTARGYLEVPLTYGDAIPSPLQILVNVGDGILSVYAVAVEYLMPAPEPQEA